MTKNKSLECEMCGEVLIEVMPSDLLQKIRNAPTDSIICCAECKDDLDDLLPNYTKVYEG